jgi:aryl-alcohol dehydrogenase-like predicted oxidoreductase
MNRREFIKTVAVGTLGAKLGMGQAKSVEGAIQSEKLPHRILGKTGVSVPILGFGTAPVGNRRSLDEAVKLYNEAIDLGVNYIDTAPDFAGYGKAQVQLGHVMKQRRKDVFLVTKCFEPKGDEARRLLERNLKELQTDYADLVYVHSLGANEMNPEIVFSDGGVFQTLMKAKEEGLTKFVGLSGHNRPGRFAEAIKQFDVSVMMNAVNFVDRHTYDFETQVWPLAAKKKIGLVAMKVFGGASGNEMSNRLLPLEHLELAFRYALSLSNVACAVIGMATKEELEQNIGWAKNFKPLSQEEMTRLEAMGKELAKKWGAHYGAVV